MPDRAIQFMELRWGGVWLYQNLRNIALPMRALLMIDNFVNPLNCICWSIESLIHLTLPKKQNKTKQYYENTLAVVYIKL